jgi:8-oxo-dGTP diphosphatase
VRIEEIVGLRIRERREQMGLSQAQFGKLIGEHLGRAWSRQAVSGTEQGQRNFAAAELVTLAHVLGMSVGQLLTPPPGVERIEIAPGIEAERDVLLTALVPAMAVDKPEEKLQETFTRLLKNIRLLNRAADGIQEDLDTLQRLGMAMQQERQAREREQPVIAAIVTSDRGVLVGRRNDRTPPWTFIAGRSEPGESSTDTIIREVKEETGCIVKVGKRLGERIHPDTGRLMIYYAAKPVHGTEIHVGDEAELAEVRWVGLAEADELLPGMFGPVREYLAREIGGG